MDATLTDRYIHAVTRTIPESQRADVAAELRALIGDELDVRIAAGEEAAASERVVLEELGDPDELAARFADRPLHLIGPRYYLDWLRLVKLLGWIVIPLATVGIALGQTLAGESLISIFAATLGGAISVAVHLVFWTTLVFAVVERSGAGTGPLAPWTIDRLPLENPDTGARFRDVITSLVFLAVAAAAMVWDQLVGAVYIQGHWMSFLSPALWPWWFGGLLVAMGVEAILQLVVYLSGRWSAVLSTVNAALNIVIAASAIALLSQGMLLNPEFWTVAIPTPDAGKVFGIISVITGFAIAAVAVWDSLDAFRKWWRTR